jgi:hypothetical protein
MDVYAMVPGQRLQTAKSCKGGTRVPDAIIGTYRLRETTPTENPRSSKVEGVEHKASNLVSEKNTAKKSQRKVNPGLIKGCRPRHVLRTASKTVPNGKNSLGRPKCLRSCSALRRRRRSALFVLRVNDLM